MLDKFIRDKHGKVVIWQWPNAALWTWIIASLLGFVTHGNVHMIISALGTIAILIWAVIEVGWGASLVRRLAGGVVLAAMLVGLVRGL